MNLTNWYALAVAPGREDKVRKTILTRLDRRGVTIPNLALICPEEEVVVSNGKERETKKKMQLPGYILLSCRSLDGKAVSTIAGASGVLEFLGGNDNPVKLPHKEVSQMLGEGTSKRRTEKLFSIGDRVTIIDGPFSDFSATITELAPDQERVHVEIEIFGRVTPAQVSLHQIKP